MIYNTRKHRNPLNRKAAKLLARYESFMRGQIDQAELEQLLRESFILPKEADVLFELYWVIQIIKQNTDESPLYLIDGTENLVATWENDEYQYEIFHDSSGPQELSFTIMANELQESNEPYLQRIHESFQKAKEYGTQLFNRTRSDIFRQGRPDIIVAIREKETKKLVKLLIGEVKYTTKVNYALTGLRELLDYMYLVKYKNTYRCDSLPVEGILCVDEIESNDNKGNEFIRLVTPISKKGLKL